MGKATLEVAAAAATRVAADAHVGVRAALHTLEEERAALESAAAATHERVAPSCPDDAGCITSAASNGDACLAHHIDVDEIMSN